MGKAPAFQFYVKDWLSDPQLRLSSLLTRGIWIDLLCFMWEAPERGKIDSTVENLSRLVGATNGEFSLFISEAQELKFCDVTCYEVTDRNKKVTANITVRNRRMWREANNKENNRLRQQRHRDKRKDNTEVTSSRARFSSSPSPSPVIKEAESDDCPFVIPDKKTKKKKAAFSRPNSKNNGDKKTREYIKTACQVLYDQRDFKKVNALINTYRKKKVNEKAIAHVLKRCIDSNKKGDLWGYCHRIIDVENGNFNEADHIAEQKAKEKERPESLKAIFKEAQK